MLQKRLPEPVPSRSWFQARAIDYVVDDDCITLTDAPVLDWHLMALAAPAAQGCRVRLSIAARPMPACDTRLLINEWGVGDVASADAAGNVHVADGCEQAVGSRTPDGTVHLHATWHNAPPRLYVGTSMGLESRYLGGGRAQWKIESVDLTILSDRADERLVVVDVGGLGGLQPLWAPFASQITPIVFEPNPPAAEALRSEIVDRLGGQVIQKALADKAGERTLYVSRSLGCSSLLAANSTVLRGYSIASAFIVTKEVQVTCVRYDALHEAGEVAAPDVIKIDVQGFEYEVLHGFGELLGTCLAVQVEAHMYPIYTDQRLLGDLISYLDNFGLTLRRIKPVEHFDGDVVEVDAWFTVGGAREAALTTNQLKRLRLIHKAWSLPARAPTFGPRA